MSTNVAPAASAAPMPSSAPAPETPVVESQSEVLEGEESLPVEDVPPVKETKAEQKKRLKSLKLKVDGEEYDEELPFEIDEDQADYMRKQLQLAKMSQKRAQYASQIEKEAYDLIELLRKDPRKVLSDPSIGIDVKKLAAEIIDEEIENSKKSPEQIEREKLEAELKSLKDKAKKEEEQRVARDRERMTKEQYERYDMAISNALEKNPDLPKTAYTLKKISENMQIAIENDIDLSIDELVPIIREEMRQDLKEMFKVMPEDVIEELVGKENITKIRKKYVSKAKAQQNNAPAPNSSPKKDKVTAEEKIPMKKFFGNL